MDEHDAVSSIRHLRRSFHLTLWFTLPFVLGSAWGTAQGALLSQVSSVASGQYHSCAIVNGGLHCWGSNGSGQIGIGNRVDQPTAFEVTGLTAGVASIATGWSHTCARTLGDAVRCWGSNASGQLGNGTTTTSLTAVDVVGLGPGVSGVAAGGNHTCSIVAGGAKCWGRNVEGQVGNGSAGTSPVTVPTLVTGLSSGVMQLALGANHSCALLVTGAVKCWGEGLGNGAAGSTSTPADVMLAAPAVSVGAGEAYSCALLNSGLVQCWGTNSRGQLGDGTFETRPQPGPSIELGGNASAISVGDRHACALVAGLVKCWGRSNEGQLGIVTTENSPFPVTVPDLPPQIRSIAAGGYHVCARTDTDTVKCWGWGHQGALGNDTLGYDRSPKLVAALGGSARSIATGGHHSCAIDASGGVKCWGGNWLGQVGNQTTTHVAVPATVNGVGVPAAMIVGGEDHSCILGTSGSVRCWGGNWAGQVGNGGFQRAGSPVDVTGLTSGTVLIAAGEYHTCAVTTAGAAKCWGFNTNGQLGNGTGIWSADPVDVMGLGTGTQWISGGSSHTCAVLGGGAVRCWGSNASGQLGTGSTTPSLTPVDVSGISAGIASVAAGEFHTCALTTGGAVKCWGSGADGRLGNGSTTNSTTPVDVSGLETGVQAITLAYRHACALLDDGSVRCWGHNTSGEIGDGTRTSATTPKNVLGLPGPVAMVRAGDGHTCALTHANQLYCWGSFGYGQLGRGTFGQSFAPVDVLASEGCAGFTDTMRSDVFCANVAWMRNRRVTLGCSTGRYCPGDAVGRLAMAAFLNRLGSALTPAILVKQEVSPPGTTDPGLEPLVCPSQRIDPSEQPRWVHWDAVFSGVANGDISLSLEAVTSTDHQTTWLADGWRDRASGVAGQWRHHHVFGQRMLMPGYPLHVALRLNRHVPSSAMLTEWSCNLRLLVKNAEP